MINKLKDKIILITGAGKGNGRILAKALAAYGAIVAANDISPINVEEVVEEINQQGGHAKAYIEDVARKVGAQNLINQVEGEFGRIDVLINHAAVEPHVPLLDMDEWDWHQRAGCQFDRCVPDDTVCRARNEGTRFGGDHQPDNRINP